MTVTTAPAIPDLSRFLLDLRSRRRDLVLGELLDLAHRRGAIRGSGRLLDTLRTRERHAPSLLGKGVALPALRSILVTRPVLVGGRAPKPIAWGNGPEGEVELVLLALAPGEMPDESWHAWLARVSALGRQQRPRQKLIDGAIGAVALLQEMSS